MNLIIGLDSWVIQDGNYGDFQVGETRQFALSFYPLLLGKIEYTTPITHKEKDTYFLNAKIDYFDKESWVIDFGIKAFQEQVMPTNFEKGQVVSGEFSLGVDHRALTY